MDDNIDADLARWFERLMAEHDDEVDQRERAYYALQNSELPLLSRVTVHKYQCVRGCQVARVVRIGSTVLCAVRDYKYSPGMNAERSVPEARRKNTLDGDKHWPGHVHDVNALAGWGDQAGLDMVCRHFHGMILASDILTQIQGVEPGHPRKPTRLG
ncbi:MAG: hypothetical protein Q7T71_10745 [Herbiconiux sp.]|nr:hypothetical protein [Herbiconiux sp.]